MVYCKKAIMRKNNMFPPRLFEESGRSVIDLVRKKILHNLVSSQGRGVTMAIKTVLTIIVFLAQPQSYPSTKIVSGFSSRPNAAC